MRLIRSAREDKFECTASFKAPSRLRVNLRDSQRSNARCCLSPLQAIYKMKFNYFFILGIIEA